ncbi:hypothetical protein BN6_21790 [Saccharothrix espanaensis DSM 44229]|uniref:Uncharacterized protein n=1 Tax=Saccharothrix espanaensis (strain ATCC 51144 / DSM 44229 / JCM 9112 / NBRC 15066 / NRRL 15764) TaxID=1179773 RepID=K0JUA0_SACES|nr:hypothetical protein BN6_21790 [Saccharothrix espanaensis DSM 44229]
MAAYPGSSPTSCRQGPGRCSRRYARQRPPGRRPEHPSAALHVKIDDHLADRSGGQATEVDRRRAGHPGGGPGPCSGSPPRPTGCGSCPARLPVALPLIKQLTRWLAADTDLGTDATWIVDFTQEKCGHRRRPVC